MKFILEIDLGNEAMQNNVNVAEQLREYVANDIEFGKDHGTIRDVNGNKVGTWEFTA